ncbi:MAG: NUDIX domain-containing protein, partial [Myxococcales bacterium]|nr:NUDIX domain-containing protein [Myxococcales bacterium]
MHRKPLRELLARYLDHRPEDHARVAEIRALVDAHADCFERNCWAGHVTGSAWVTTPDRRRALLVHHRKLGRWLQPGGHADGESLIEQVALREAREETGLADLRLHVAQGGLAPLDVDVHPIPARGA